MDAKYLGPFTITKRLGKGLYSLQLVDSPTVKVERVNSSHLKPYLVCNFPPHQTAHLLLPIHANCCTGGGFVCVYSYKEEIH